MLSYTLHILLYNIVYCTLYNISYNAGKQSVLGFAAFAGTSDFASLSSKADPSAFKKTDGTYVLPDSCLLVIFCLLYLFNHLLLFNSGFKWSGAGSTMFSDKTNDSSQSADDNPEAFEASVDFKPVLEQLPDLIEVKTGQWINICTVL